MHRIARCTWRLRVIETIEDYKLTRLKLDSAPGSYLPELSVIERRTDVQLHRAIQALAAKRKQDHGNMKNKLDELPPPGQWPRPELELEGGEGEAPGISEPIRQAFGGPDGIFARTNDDYGHGCPPNPRAARDVQDDHCL